MQIVSKREKALKNTNLVAAKHIKRESASLPVDIRCSKTSLLKLPHLRAKEDVREKKGECFQDFQEIQGKKDDCKKTTKMPRNRHKMWQALGLSSLSFTWSLALRHYTTAFRARLCPRAKYKKRSIWGGGSPLPISFPPPPLSAPDTQAKSTKHDMKPHPNNSLPTFKAECRT